MGVQGSIAGGDKNRPRQLLGKKHANFSNNNVFVIRNLVVSADDFT